jgi:predicted double-glycine peptidase
MRGIRFARVLGAAAVLMSAAAYAGNAEMPLQTGGAYKVPVTSLREGRFLTTLRQQYDFSCGSAALSTLLTHHYGIAVSEQTVFEEMFAGGDQQKIRMAGFSLLDMKRYLERHGFAADGFEADLSQLEQANIPAIALVNENGYNHFVVVKGLRQGRVLIGDPAQGTRALPQRDFEAMWQNRILFVINNRQELARFNLASDWKAAPRAPLARGLQGGDLNNIVLPKLGPSDF